MLSAIALGTVAPAVFLTLAATEELQYPVDVAVAADGAILVADLEAAAVLRWNGSDFEVVARGEGLPRTPLFGIRHIAPDADGTLVASDPATMALYRLEPPARSSEFRTTSIFVTPWGVCRCRRGGVLAVDRVTRRLRLLSESGIEDLAEIEAGRAILPGADGELFVLTDRNIVRVRDGALEPLIQSSPFEFPHDLARGGDGTFFVTDGYARCVWAVSPEGRVSKLASGTPLHESAGARHDRRRRVAGRGRPRPSHLPGLPDGSISPLD